MAQPPRTPQEVIDISAVLALVADMHEVGVGMMRRRLVAQYGEQEGLARLRAWLADGQQGPGQPARHRRLA